MNRKSFITLNISIGRYADFIKAITGLALKKESSYICIANVHMAIEAYYDKNFANLVNAADIITPDGVPLAKGIKMIYGIDQDRVAGMDLLPDLIEQSATHQLGIFFYGGTQKMLDETCAYIKENYPLADIKGAISPPFRSLSPQEEEDTVNQINIASPHIVFVVLGCPKQEKWMAAMKGRVNSLMIGVGGALPVMIGQQKRAPNWMQKYSLEWLYRLFQEPKRLFKRYFITNTVFIFLLLRQLIFRKDLRGTSSN